MCSLSDTVICSEQQTKVVQKCYFCDLAENFPGLPFSQMNRSALWKWGQLDLEILLC